VSASNIDEVRTAERTRLGFTLHGANDQTRVYVRKRDRRTIEGVFRQLGVVIVDEYGARIDKSQFEKERDPSFNKNPGPGFWRLMYELFMPLWVLNWRWRRDMRQSSDDA
jgi:hypothetical protein